MKIGNSEVFFHCESDLKLPQEKMYGSDEIFIIHVYRYSGLDIGLSTNEFGADKPRMSFLKEKFVPQGGRFENGLYYFAKHYSNGMKFVLDGPLGMQNLPKALYALILQLKKMVSATEVTC